MLIPLIGTLFFVIAIFLPIALSVITTKNIQARLSELSQDIYAATGLPNLAKPSIVSSIAFARFMWSSRSLSLGDHALRRRIVQWRYFAVWSGVGFLVFAGFFISGFVIWGPSH